MEGHEGQGLNDLHELLRLLWLPVAFRSQGQAEPSGRSLACGCLGGWRVLRWSRPHGLARTRGCYACAVRRSPRALRHPLLRDYCLPIGRQWSGRLSVHSRHRSSSGAAHVVIRSFARMAAKQANPACPAICCMARKVTTPCNYMTAVIVRR